MNVTFLIVGGIVIISVSGMLFDLGHRIIKSKHTGEIEKLKYQKEILELEVKKEEMKIKLLEEENKKLDKIIYDKPE